jgi:phosphate transport system permease protein
MAVALTPPSPPAPPAEDVPRTITARRSAGDLIFRGAARAAGISVLVITALILVFLLLRSTWALRTAGLSFLTTQNWVFVAGHNSFGIGGVLPDTIVIAIIALCIGVPVAIGAALFISECAPRMLRRPLIAVIDLMAAIPSIIYGLWGRFFLMPRIIGPASWMARHLSAIPVFRVPGAGGLSSAFVGSPAIAGTVVCLMVIPIVTSLSREVFSQAPQGEREAAYALGSTRWGMVRAVVLPFGRAGVIGAVMLGMGRALGETIAVLLIVNQTTSFNWHVLASGGNSIAAMIANIYREATPNMLSALMAAGLVLFSMTLIVNSLAAIVINRSRSGALTAD